MSKWLSETRRAAKHDAKLKNDLADNADVVVDPVFGELDLEHNGPNFRGVSAAGAFVLFTKANLGLGVLAIPTVFDIFGIVPGVLVILGIELMLGYCASFLGQFKVNHPEVYGLADAGFVFGGRIGKEIFYIIFSICESNG